MTTVLVTGCAGFIGSVVTEQLLEKGYNVIGIDDLRSSYRESIHPSINKFYKKDFGDQYTLTQIFEVNKIDCVMHLAAESIIEKCMTDPALFFYNNVSNGLNLLEMMNYYGVKNIIYSSTASVYGNPVYTPINENHIIDPINSYGLSKYMFEQILDWYRKAYGFRYCIFRYFNVGGATKSHGENRKGETRLVPITIDNIIHDKPTSIFGNNWNTPDGTCHRDYVHVSDIADAHLLGINYLDKSDHGIFNLGGEREFSVLEIIHLLETIIGKKAEIKFTDRRQGDPETLLASSEWAKKELGWKPQYSDLETILKDSYDWYRNLHNI